MASFKEWKDAHTAAVTLARQLGREVGILKAKEYTATVFQVIHLPKPENRQGFELRAEIVRPSDPYGAWANA
jgi:hypothetical protein